MYFSMILVLTSYILLFLSPTNLIQLKWFWLIFNRLSRFSSVANLKWMCCSACFSRTLIWWNHLLSKNWDRVLYLIFWRFGNFLCKKVNFVLNSFYRCSKKWYKWKDLLLHFVPACSPSLFYFSHLSKAFEKSVFSKCTLLSLRL